MKNFLLLILISTLFFITAFKVAEAHLEPIKELPDKMDTVSYIGKVEVLNIDLKTHNSFLDKIGFYESSNDYSKVNRFGYMGKYQFHVETLKLIDINVPKKQFLSSPILQEEAMKRLLTENKKTLRYFIKKYNGKVKYGVYITESGVLAAAHLGGAGNVIKWFRNGEDFQDANGTPITKYMKTFSGYNLNLE